MNAEKKAANILMQRGVAVPVAAPLFLRLFGKKTIHLVVKAPDLRASIKVAYRYLQLGIENTGEMTLPEAFTLLKTHGRSITQIIALCISPTWFRPLSWLLMRRLNHQELNYLFTMIILYGGIEDFINTIRLIEATRITKPMNIDLSPDEATS